MVKQSEPRKKKMLIVEDETSLLEVLGKKFEARGLEVLKAKDGKEGFVMAVTSHPDVIILDLIMPNIDGITMLTQLREDDWGKSLPVIILTNKQLDDRGVKNLMKLDPSYYLVKVDNSLVDVMGKVDEVLG